MRNTKTGVDSHLAHLKCAKYKNRFGFLFGALKYANRKKKLIPVRGAEVCKPGNKKHRILIRGTAAYKPANRAAYHRRSVTGV